MVRKLRYQRDLTQAMLTARCSQAGWDVSENTIAKIEAQIRCVTDREVVFLAKALRNSRAGLVSLTPPIACRTQMVLPSSDCMFFRVLLLLSAIAFAATGAELVIDFTDTPPDKLPNGFSSLLSGRGKPGEWKVLQDELPADLAPLSGKGSATTRRAVIAQTGFDTTDERFPILLYDKETFGDFTLTTRFKLVDGTMEQMAGIAFRVRDADNFYVIRASGLGNSVRFYKVVAGQRSVPIGPEVPVAKNTWHELKIQCEGNKIRCWFNGNPPFPELQDNSFASGRIGFWTKSDSISYFASTRISYTPRESLVEVLVRDAVKDNPRLLGLRIYLAGENGTPVVAASKDATEMGMPGGESEKAVLANGEAFYGKDKGTVSIVLPLRNRNGDPMAAVRFNLKSFPGEIQQATLTRVQPILKKMQAKTQTVDELR